MTPICGTIIAGIAILICFLPWLWQYITESREVITAITLYAETPEEAIRKASADIDVRKYRMEHIRSCRYRFVRK